jgi:HTH-type transcriptional regulator/antitoxin HigA
MRENESRPPPPGDFIREELRARGWSQEDLARVLGRTTARVNEIITGKQELSPEIAMALEMVFGPSASEWLRRESAYRLSLVSADTREIKRRAKLYGMAPVKEMQKRGWIRPGDDITTIEEDVLKLFGIADLEEEPKIHGAMRKTASTVPATPAQRAWAFRVRQVAEAIPAASLGRYEESRLDACQADLRKLAAYSGEVKKVPGLLMKYGVRFVAVEGLPGTKVDGFATWLDEVSPVIGVSLRFDRLDSFWFTLGHEWSHIRHRDFAPVDSDISGNDGPPLEVKPPEERRADAEAAAMLVPPEELESFILRVGPLYSTEKINQFSNRIKMHPAIVIGQLKHRGQIGYSAHNRNIPHVREAVTKAAVTDGWSKNPLTRE